MSDSNQKEEAKPEEFKVVTGKSDNSAVTP